jgi:transcription antitermination factor NusG
MRTLKVGDKVRVPWGLDEPVDGEVIEVWDDTAHHIRVEVRLAGEDTPVLLLLTRSTVEAA